LGIALVPIVGLLTVPPLAEFAKYETEDLSWNHPGSSTHAEGIVWLYKSGFTDPENILGSGMGEDPDVNHESGYGWLLEHFGLAAYLLWMWFLVAMYRHSKLRDSRQWQIPLLSQAMIVGTFVVMHFSYYPFSFVGWIPIWYIFGLSVAGPSTAANVALTSKEFLANQTPKLLPETGQL
jgi:hypothetical protein